FQSPSDLKKRQGQSFALSLNDYGTIGSKMAVKISQRPLSIRLGCLLASNGQLLPNFFCAVLNYASKIIFLFKDEIQAEEWCK
ncbi:MAG: hypothetical protein LC677_16045, partial [Halomonas sp.]|nr:hypothetical protein [Halomonas sp.]